MTSSPASPATPASAAAGATQVSDPAAAADAGAAGEASQSRKDTLPPPEWVDRDGPLSAASLTLELDISEPPIPRRPGARAEIGSLRARLDAQSGGVDAETERTSSATLARALAGRGEELDTATRLARRALVLGEDPPLREELSLWFAGLGEPALAAATLRHLVDDQKTLADDQKQELVARTLSRIAVLLARSGDAAAAADALEQAARRAPADPLPGELLGALAAWAPDAVAAERASKGYLEGAERREALGERPGAFEDLLRAYEIAPGNALAAERLHAVLSERGRAGAADEVLREHARAAGAAGRAVQVKRLRDAVEAGDWPRAVGAGLDAILDAEIDAAAVLGSFERGSGSATPGETFDRTLHRTGLHELMAARWELCAEAVTGAIRARLKLALGRLYATLLGSPERAADAWIEALALDPSSEEAKDSLRAHSASTRDHGPLLEALIRVGLSDDAATSEQRVACLRELSVLAEQRLNDPGLALWSAQRALAAGGEDEELKTAVARLSSRASFQSETLVSVFASLESKNGRDRLDPLRKAAAILRGRPDQADAYTRILSELSELAPEERSWQLALERLLGRLGRSVELESALANALARATSAAERERARLMLAASCRRRDDLAGALREIEPLLDEAAAHPAGLSMAVVLAGRAGNDLLRARSLLRLSLPLPPPLRAVISSAAAELFLSAGEVDRALEAAEQGCHADPSLSRATAARAAVAAKKLDRAGVAALERAMGVVVPRASLCRALAEANAEIGEPILALAWSQRWLALRPGDPAAASAVLARASAIGDGQRLADALGWLLSQPQPLLELAAPLATALRQLANLDAGRAAALARRALDVLGPRHDELRSAVLQVADAVGDRSLGIAVVERWLAAGAPGEGRADLLLDVARRRKAAGDADGALRALLRAIIDGADATAVLAELDVALPAATSDGELAQLEVRAEAQSAAGGTELGEMAQAWRELGAARWDLAGDTRGAVRAWERAATLDSERGIWWLARDLLAFAGRDEALARLEDYASRRREPAQTAAVFSVAAKLALQNGAPREALRISARALELDPSHADVLAVAEHSASDEDLDQLEAIYDRLAKAALGCYGERAAHYRAGRQFERRGAPERALKHAVRAFEVVPAEGVAFVLMARLSERAGRADEIVGALARVASRCEDPGVRAAWLKRAAVFAGPTDDGKRQRVDILLRALSVRPGPDTLRALGSALAELIALAPEDREIVEMRFERALEGLLPRVDGPEGARLACQAARVALESFESGRLALLAIERAIACDGDVEEFHTLRPFIGLLANADDPARALVARALGLAGEKFASVGRALLELCAELASELDDPVAEARLLVQAACRDPEDKQLVRRAQTQARRSGDSQAQEQIQAAVTPHERVSGMLEAAKAAEEHGDVAGAIEALESVRGSADVEEEQQRESFQQLRELYARSSRRDALERLLQDEVSRSTGDPARHIALARDLSALVSARGDAARALDILAQVRERFPDDEGVLGDVVEIAQQAGDEKRCAEALGRLVDVAVDSALRLVLLQKLAPLLEDIGERALAYARYSEILHLDPNNVIAIAALERDAERRGDHERLVELLSRRAALASMVDDVRRIHLHRAAVLEQRLGRPDEARVELEAVLAATGDNLNVLRMLADLNERLAAPLRAAPLWLRASASARDREEAADLSRRACEAYLAGGDVDAARRVLDGMEAWARSAKVAELRVEIERRSDNPVSLAEALEEYALASLDPPERRAALLIEAARASITASDPQAALSRAQRAARIAPGAPEPQLCARWLEYLNRGTGSVEDARITVAELRAIAGDLDPAQTELRSFLLAEAIDVAVGAGAGLRELQRAHAEVGSRPLLAVGLGERLAMAGEPARALALFDIALAGDLQRVRPRGRVAVRAAEAARALGELERALSYLETAVADADSRAEALGLQAELRAQLRPDSEVDKRVIESALEKPPDPAKRSPVPEPRPASDPPPSSAALPVARPFSTTPRPRTQPLPRSDSDPSLAAPGSEGPLRLRESVRPAAERPSRVPRSDPAEAEAPQSSRRSPMAVLAATSLETTLLTALDKGSVQAGKELILQLENRADRTHDLAAVCRRVAVLLPGDRWTLDKLHDAALADRNIVYARAIEHVLRAFEAGGRAVDPPPLADQAEQPDSVRALLFRGTTGPAAEALALVWDGAEHVFRRDPGTYGVTGMERIPVGAQTPLGRVYSGAARVLGLTRTPLFQRRTAGAVTLSVALLSPPALILSGDVRQEAPELRFHVGAMLAATLPEFVLLFGVPESQARAVLKALALAFGSPQHGQGNLGSVANLAEVLWESIPARSQRRLRELCDDAKVLDYDRSLAAARLAVRRAGLFISADLRIALRETCADEGISARVLEEPNGLAALCEASPAVSDLVRLATSPEYAQARWQLARPRHPTGSWATY